MIYGGSRGVFRQVEDLGQERLCFFKTPLASNRKSQPCFADQRARMKRAELSLLTRDQSPLNGLGFCVFRLF